MLANIAPERPLAVSQTLPLVAAQPGIWMADQLAAASNAYVVAQYVELNGRLDVGSHLGLRISDSESKKPSNVIISGNDILTFDGFSRRFSSKNWRASPVAVPSSIERLEQQILELAGFGKPNCRIRRIFSSNGFSLSD